MYQDSNERGFLKLNGKLVRYHQTYHYEHPDQALILTAVHKISLIHCFCCVLYVCINGENARNNQDHNLKHYGLRPITNKDKRYFNCDLDIHHTGIIQGVFSMKNIQAIPNHRPLFLFLFMLVLTSLIASNSANAGDDRSIKGDLRKNIQYSMGEYITKQTIDGKLYVFDAVQNKLLTLTSGKPRPGIVKDGEFYLTCADYTDQDGNKIDLDFMVRKSGEKYITTQTIVHAVDEKYRPYHVRDRNN